VKLFVTIILFAISLVPEHVKAQSKDICDIIKIPNCPAVSRQIRRSSMQSVPSPSVAASLNPANVTFDRGLGLELIFQPGNSMAWGFASGTGRIGGALISSSLENSFFGNRIVEPNEKFFERNENKKQYEHNKNTIALGGRLFGKRKFNLDAGIILKRHKEIKKINPGVGLSGKLYFLTFGYAVYKDDFRIKLDDISGSTLYGYDAIVSALNKPVYDESFMVQTLSFGTRIGDLSVDYGMILSNYKYIEAQHTRLLALSYAYKKVLFNFAQRQDHSMLPKYISGKLDYEELDQTSYYGGIQYSLGKHVIVGTSYNYFFLRDVSFNVTFFL
jgi:hypothetical protein